MTNDKQLLNEIDRQLADPKFNPAQPKGLKPLESKATLVTLPDGSTAMLWQHAKWQQALAFARKHRGQDTAYFTFQHAIIIGHTREVVRTVGKPQKLAFIEGAGFEMINA